MGYKTSQGLLVNNTIYCYTMELSPDQETTDSGDEERKIDDSIHVHAGNDDEITDLETLMTPIIQLGIIITETPSPKVILYIY